MVLGPLLGNLAYNSVLRVPFSAATIVICYADDTLVLTEEDIWERTSRLAELAVEMVMAAKIQKLGMRVAPQKTEAI